MALKKTQELENGLTVTDGYNRIDQILWQKNSGTARLYVNLYANQEKAEGGTGNEIQGAQKHYDMPLNVDATQNIIAEGYDHLKKEDDFKDAVDV